MARAMRSMVFAAATVCFLVLAGGAVAHAGTWQDNEFEQTTFRAGVVEAPVEGVCATGIIGGGVEFTWLAPTAGIAPRGYEVTLLIGSQVQNTVVVAPSQTSIRSGSLIGTVLSDTTYTIEVRAVVSSWKSAPISGTFRSALLGSTCSW